MEEVRWVLDNDQYLERALKGKKGENIRVLRKQWKEGLQLQEELHEDAKACHVSVPPLLARNMDHSLWHDLWDAVFRLRSENNLLLFRVARSQFKQKAWQLALDNGRDLNEDERHAISYNPNYHPEPWLNDE